MITKTKKQKRNKKEKNLKKEKKKCLCVVRYVGF